jgi:hypothetical protein
MGVKASFTVASPQPYTVITMGRSQIYVVLMKRFVKIFCFETGRSYTVGDLVQKQGILDYTSTAK